MGILGALLITDYRCPAPLSSAPVSGGSDQRSRTDVPPVPTINVPAVSRSNDVSVKSINVSSLSTNSDGGGASGW